MMRRRSIALIVAGWCAVLVGLAPRAHGLSMSVSTAYVNQPGDTAQVCVSLSGGNGQVAGTQNDLTWDGTCATLSTPPNCREAGSHRKPLAVDYPKNGDDFTIRAILISFNNTDPMPDGLLYCCTFTVEASPGQCCPISVRNALGSNSTGDKSLPASGNQAQLCTKSDNSGRGGGGFNSPSANQPLSASNAPGDAGAGNVPAPAANAPGQGGGSARAPVSQVLPGGGAAPGSLPGGGPGVAPGSIEPGVAPTAAAAPAIPATAAIRPALPPPTAAATLATAAATAVRTAAATAAAPAAATAVRSSGPAATPSRPRFAHTAVPSRRAGANAQQVAPAADESSSSWFGCQTVAGATATPVLGLGAVAALAALIRRRHGGRR